VATTSHWLETCTVRWVVHRYESRGGVERGRQRGGGPVVEVPYRIIEGVMDLIPTGSPQ
jgi:hypothetical protein